MKHHEIDLNRIKTISIHDRVSKVTIQDLAQVYKTGGSFQDFLVSMPPLLKSSDFKAVVDAVVSAYKDKKEVIWMMGAHVIKCGLGPVIIDLIERGIITAVCTNGAVVIHDLELACFGHTSEDVAANLVDGTFGMSAETAYMINAALFAGQQEGLGYGESIGKKLSEETTPSGDVSVFAAAYKKGIPITVFVGIGTEITHQHPSSDGKIIGELSMRDFRILSNTLCNLDSGGVVLNVGSAVILPEVFLKALTVVRNLGHPAEGFTAVNIDMIQHYRPHENVVSRPTLTGGKGYEITGHHEIMIPILAAAVKEALSD